LERPNCGLQVIAETVASHKLPLYMVRFCLSDRPRASMKDTIGALIRPTASACQLRIAAVHRAVFERPPAQARD
jgi:hypothetical protein